MQWLNTIVDELIARHPEGEIVLSSGVSPSGTYHLGTLREVMTAEAVAYELRLKGRQAKHIHVVDDHDIFRKLPVNVPEGFKQYLGKPLSEVPSPDGSDQSYADFFLKDLLSAASPLHLELDVMHSEERYKQGYFTEAIEIAIAKSDKIKQIQETISGHKVDDQWSPVQVNEDSYLKKRQIVGIDKDNKTLTFVDGDGKQRDIRYDKGEVKLNWRVDWPARWWLLGVDAEPFGRDHATKGGSYDTGKAIVESVFGGKAPLPIPYNFIMRSGDTKKMSKSAGNTITAAQLLEILPSEVLWFFIMRYSPDKELFFDEGATLMRLVDEFGELLAKSDKSDSDKQLIGLCLHGIEQPTVSRIPFSHLVASYQAALRDPNKTLDIIGRTEYAEVVQNDSDIIKSELRFIDAWLDKFAPEEVKFALRQDINPDEFNETERKFLSELATKISKAPDDADGAWFHQAIYELKDSSGLQPKELFGILYKVIIGKSSGPRAGWFLSILPRNWLVKRLKLETKPSTN
jgi:lysyl-tRNA synthetase class 1